MTHHRISLILLLAVAMCGCRSFGPLAKRESEMNCPTDIRRTVPWCWGQDAIFNCPCGPTDDFYGHKPTCWRCWPAPASQWRNAYCGCPPVCPPDVPTCVVGPEMMVLPPTEVEGAEPIQGLDGGPAAPPAIEALPPTSAAPVKFYSPGAAAEVAGQANATSQVAASPRRAIPAIFRPSPEAAVQPAVDVSPPDAGDAVQLAADPGVAEAEAGVSEPWAGETSEAGEDTTVEFVAPAPVEDPPAPIPPAHRFMRAVERALGGETH